MTTRAATIPGFSTPGPAGLVAGTYLPVQGPTANRAPVLTVPPTFAVELGRQAAVATISVADADADNLTLSLTGDGVIPSFNYAAGTIDDLNTLLAGLIITGTAEGAATLTATLGDGEYVDVEVINGNVLPATLTNVAPVVIASGDVQVFEGGTATVAFVILDGDAGTSTLEASITTDVGTLRLGNTSGVTFTGGGNSTAAMTVTGTIDGFNLALAAVRLDTVDGDAGQDAIVTCLVDDQHPVDPKQGSAARAVQILDAPPPSGDPDLVASVVKAPPHYQWIPESATTLSPQILAKDQDEVRLASFQLVYKLGIGEGIDADAGIDVWVEPGPIAGRLDDDIGIFVDSDPITIAAAGHHIIVHSGHIIVLPKVGDLGTPAISVWLAPDTNWPSLSWTLRIDDADTLDATLPIGANVEIVQFVSDPGDDTWRIYL